MAIPKAMRERSPGQRMRAHHQDDVRAKIQVSQIINRLKSHIDGEIELSATQVSCAKILLDKALSNAPTNLDATIDGRVEIVMSGVHHGLESDAQG